MTVRSVISGRTSAAIADSIERALGRGVLAPGQALPPVRVLAATLRVSPVTVAGAYRHLRTRGLALGEGRRGTRLRAAPAGRPVPAPPFGSPNARLATGVDLVDLASGNPRPDLLPSLDTVLRTMAAGPDLYGTAALNPALRDFATEELRADGIPNDALAVAHGALDAIDRLLRDHLRAGDRVAVEDPVMPALLDLIAASGFVAEPIGLDAEGALPDDVEQALARRARAIILTPRAQNPTGAAMSAARTGDLVHLLRPHRDVLLIENDAASAIAGVPAVTLSAAASRWAHVRSVAKFLGPDLRVALVAGDALTLGRFVARQAVGERWVSHLLQRLTAALWSDPAGGRRLARAADVYARNRQALIAALAAHGIVVSARSGFNVWIPVPEETAAVQVLAQRGWAVAAGARFRLQSPPGIRVTTSALAPEAASRFAADCADAIRPLPGTSA